jgi:hypothetical protein
VGHLKSWWTHLITPSQNFVVVWWQSLFQSTPLASDTLLTSLHPLLENVLQTTDHFEISCLRAPFSWLEKPRNCTGQVRSGLYGRHYNGVPPIHFFQEENRIQFRSHTTQFLGFSSHDKGAPRQEISKWSMVCSMFLRSWWNIVRSTSFAKGGTSKKRLSLHLHKVVTWSNKVSPWTLQTALINNFTRWQLFQYWCIVAAVVRFLRVGNVWLLRT